MKIMLISTNIFQLPVQGYSGLEHLVWQIGKGLAEKKHAVTIVAPKGSTCPGCSIHGTNLKESEHISFRNYEKQLNSFDVILDHSWESWSYIGKIEGNCKPPIIKTCHAPINTMYQTKPPIDKPCFIGISQDHTQSIKDHLKIDARCAYNGVDMDFYKPLNLKRNNHYLFLARFSSIKGPDLAIGSCLTANKPLDLIGDSEITNEPAYLQQIQQTCNNNSLFKFIGPQSREQCVTWFSTSKALIHSAFRFREPFGLAPVESQACFCPVIASDNGALRETILHGETGFVVKTPEEVTELLKSDAVNTIKPERCREWAAQFSVQNMIAKYEELCTEAISTGGW